MRNHVCEESRASAHDYGRERVRVCGSTLRMGGCAQRRRKMCVSGWTDPRGPGLEAWAVPGYRQGRWWWTRASVGLRDSFEKGRDRLRVRCVRGHTRLSSLDLNHRPALGGREGRGSVSGDTRRRDSEGQAGAPRNVRESRLSPTLRPSGTRRSYRVGTRRPGLRTRRVPALRDPWPTALFQKKHNDADRGDGLTSADLPRDPPSGVGDVWFLVPDSVVGYRVGDKGPGGQPPTVLPPPPTTRGLGEG